MYKDRRILAVIPARGGSKGLPGKNIRPLAGIPLINWSITAAKQSGFFDEIMVSTDSHEIAAVAREAGASLPFLRPSYLATDNATTMDTLEYTLSWYSEKGYVFEMVCLLQPTSPLRTAEDISNAMHLCEEKEAQAVVSVCEAGHHPFWMNTLPESLCMDGFLRQEALDTPRQALPRYYQLNGALYLGNSHWVRQNRSFYGAESFAYIMPRERSIDIDTLMDFHLAEFFLAKR